MRVSLSRFISSTSADVAIFLSLAMAPEASVMALANLVCVAFRFLSNGKVADARLGLLQGRFVCGRRGCRIVRSGRHDRYPGLLGLSRNLRCRHDRFVCGARSGPPARTHAAGWQEAAALARIFSLVLFMHWIVAGLDRGRFHWSDDVPGWLQGVCLFTVAAGYALALWAMRVNRFFSSVIASSRPRPARRHHGTLRLRPPSRLHRRDF